MIKLVYKNGVTMAKQVITISHLTFIRLISYILGIWFLYQIRGIIVTVFVAFILMTAIRPLVRLGHKYKIPSLAIVLSLFLLFLSLVTTLVASLIPAVTKETVGLINNFPTYLSILESRFSFNLDPNLFTSQINSIPSNILSLAAGAFGNILIVMAVFFMTYYLLSERASLHKYLTRFFGKTEAEHKAEVFVEEVEKRIGGWVRGQLLLMLIIGLMTYIGLILLGIPYALPLALLAGFLEAVPSLGPIISAIPPILLGLTISPVSGLGALAMSVLIQQLENNIIVPRVMLAATGVRPLITILVLMIGFTLGGIIGAVLAVPAYLTIDSLIRHMRLEQK